MSPMRRLFFIIGLPLVVGTEVVAGLLAAGAIAMPLLSVTWLFVPAPLVYLMLVFDRVRPRLLRWPAIGYVVLTVVLTLLFLGVGGWYFSDELKENGLVASPSSATFDLEVVAIDENQVTLRPVPNLEANKSLAKSGIWGLDGQDSMADCCSATYTARAECGYGGNVIWTSVLSRVANGPAGTNWASAAECGMTLT